MTKKRFFTIARLRRCLLILAGLVTLIAIFYAEENWRGQRAWQKCKHDLEAQGRTLDWKALIPPAVPDEENFFKAPHMAEWFIGRGSTDLTKRLADTNSLNPSALIAQIEVVQPSGKETNADLVVAVGDSESAKKIHQLMQSILPANLRAPQDWVIAASPSALGHPPVIAIESDTPLDEKKFERLFGKYYSVFLAKAGDRGISPRDFRIVPAGANKFQLLSNNYRLASDYLKWSDQFAGDFQLIKDAVRRPFARMDGDYSEPIAIPIPNFVALRTISQMMIARAQCYLLLNEPAKALEELTTLHRLCQICEARPSGKPMTLVAAMIDVAIQGVYASAVADGLHLRTWRDTELHALQAQCGEVHLLPLVATAFQSQLASTPRNFELRSGKQIAEQINWFWKTEPAVFRGLAPLELRYGPRGWLDQNLVTFSHIQQECLKSFDLDAGVISPRQTEATIGELTEMKARSAHLPNPYTFLTVIFVPNYIRAVESMARNQTDLNLAYVACALERYHLARHEYPETLTALVPQFADHLPHDIVNGQPLHYHRTDGGRFKLYSVGWNEKDDGGVSGNDTAGDWVWQYPLQ